MTPRGTSLKRWIATTTEVRPVASQGVALVLVLWMLVLLSAIAANLVYSSRTEILIAANLVARARAEAAADAGVYRAVYELSRAAADPTAWKPDGAPHRIAYDGYDLRITITSESGKIDLNAAPDTLLLGLFISAGLSQDAATAMVDAIGDWRDSDDLRRPQGAELADYQAAGRDYGPANGPFETIEELQQILGITPDLFNYLAPLVTVHSRQPGINSAVAPRGVLLALPGISAEQVDAYIAQRNSLVLQGIAPPPLAQGQMFGSRGLTGEVTIQVEAFFGDNTSFLRETTLRLTGDVREPVTILTWRSPTRSSPPNAEH